MHQIYYHTISIFFRKANSYGKAEDDGKGPMCIYKYMYVYKKTLKMVQNMEEDKHESEI